jgi:U3 small nucleolar RNA-associated protein 3
LATNSCTNPTIFSLVFCCKAVGATRTGQQYLVTKALLQSSMALNVAMYLLVKSEHKPEGASNEFAMEGNDASSIQAHPVMARLQQWNSLAQKLEDRVENKVANLSDQVDNLVKAAALMQSDQVEDDDEMEEDSGSEKEEAATASLHQEVNTSPEEHGVTASSSEDDEEEISWNVLNEAKFGLRPNEIASKKQKRGRKRPVDSFADLGEVFVDQDDGKSGKAKSSFASTLNAIEQRTATKSRKRRPAPLAEQLDDPQEDDEELRSGLRMMEEELERPEGGMDGKGDQNDDEIDDELDDGDELGFYDKVAKKSQDKKAFKKSLYHVAPKYPRLEKEVEGERAVSGIIMKNRGLVPHKAKINRNPRVKKREQYRKALISRKGAVREVRTEEGHKYGGEETGIKSGLSRSRKLVS